MNSLINKSELARKIGLTSGAFRNKLLNIQNRSFTKAEKEKIKQVLINLAKEILKND